MDGHGVRGGGSGMRCWESGRHDARPAAARCITCSG